MNNKFSQITKEKIFQPEILPNEQLKGLYSEKPLEEIIEELSFLINESGKAKITEDSCWMLAGGVALLMLIYKSDKKIIKLAKGFCIEWITSSIPIIQAMLKTLEIDRESKSFKNIMSRLDDEQRQRSQKLHSLCEAVCGSLISDFGISK